MACAKSLSDKKSSVWIEITMSKSPPKNFLFSSGLWINNHEMIGDMRHVPLRDGEIVLGDVNAEAIEAEPIEES
jgi:hypothetical protein